MSDRLKQINRILKLQNQLRALSEWTLVAIDKEKTEIQESQQRVLASLEKGDLALHDRFIRNASSRLKTLAADESRLVEAREGVEAGLQRQERMIEITRRQLGRLQKDVTAQEEKRQLGVVLDTVFSGAQTSFAQAAPRSLKRK